MGNGAASAEGVVDVSGEAVQKHESIACADQRSYSVGVLAQFAGPSAALLAYRVAAIKRKDLAAALKLDDDLEDHGMHADDRITCYSCQSWADDDHAHPLFGGQPLRPGL